MALNGCPVRDSDKDLKSLEPIVRIGFSALLMREVIAASNDRDCLSSNSGSLESKTFMRAKF
jgi:hypothetical protein